MDTNKILKLAAQFEKQSQVYPRTDEKEEILYSITVDALALGKTLMSQKQALLAIGKLNDVIEEFQLKGDGNLIFNVRSD